MTIYANEEPLRVWFSEDNERAYLTIFPYPNEMTINFLNSTVVRKWIDELGKIEKTLQNTENAKEEKQKKIADLSNQITHSLNDPNETPEEDDAAF